jgi:hypothetical protein
MKLLERSIAPVTILDGQGTVAARAASARAVKRGLKEVVS